MSLRTNRLGAWTVLATFLLISVAVACEGVRHHYLGMRSRTPTMDRLHQIGIAIMLYAQDHRGTYPDSLSQLAKAEGMAPDWPLCPDDEGKTDPRTAYIYLGRGLTVETADAVTAIAHEPTAFFGGRGCNVLFGDGHLEWCDATKLPSLLARGEPVTRPTTDPAR